MKSLMPLLVIGLVGLIGCAEKVDPAPLKGGEVLEYHTTTSGIPSASLTFEKSSKGFIINSSGYPPQEVGPNLLDGRGLVNAFNLGMVWLEPRHRTIGAKTRLGDVKAEQQRSGRDVFLVNERNGAVQRYFDKSTGFLVYARWNPSGPDVELVRSTIEGL